MAVPSRSAPQADLVHPWAAAGAKVEPKAYELAAENSHKALCKLLDDHRRNGQR